MCFDSPNGVKNVCGRGLAPDHAEGDCNYAYTPDFLAEFEGRRKNDTKEKMGGRKRKRKIEKREA